MVMSAEQEAAENKRPSQHSAEKNGRMDSLDVTQDSLHTTKLRSSLQF